MPEFVRNITRNFPVVNFNARSAVVWLLVITLIVALFFIPDIANYQASLSKSKPIEESPIVEVPQAVEEQTQGETPEIAHERARRVSPLEEVALMLESRPRGAGANAENADGSAATATFGNEPLTWTTFKSQPVRDALTRARNQMGVLWREIPESKKTARFALTDYMNGIDLILNGSEETMPAADAVQYLQNLDMRVSRTMSEDNVDHADYMRWSQITLGPLLTQSAAMQERQRLAKPFNPRMTLGYVEIRTPPVVNPEGPQSVMRFTAYVWGRDANKIDVFRNGVWMDVIPVSQPDENGRRSVYYERAPADGLWTFRIKNEFGEVYEKTYAFFPKAQKFPVDREGVRLLPYLRLASASPNQKLDKVFTARVRLQGKEGEQKSAGLNYERF